MIPEKMEAFQITGKEKAEVREVKVPELKDEKSILIKNEAATICNMTDLHIFEGVHEPNGPSGWDMPLPFTLGHESSGIVVKKGKAVSGIEIGDRVSLRGFFESGSFAEYTMANDGYVKMPPAMTPVEGALLEMLSAVYMIVEATFTLGESVTVLGGGAAASYAIKLLKAGGATKLIVSEPHPGKREYALSIGAQHVIDPENEDVVEKVKQYTDGKMTDVCIELTGYPQSLAVMNSVIRREGRVGLFGVCPQPTMVNMYDLHMNWAAIFSAGYHRGYTNYAHEKALELVEAKVVTIDDLITHKIKMPEISNALHMIKEGKENIRKIQIEF